MELALTDCLLTVRIIGAVQGGTAIGLATVVGLLVRWLQLEIRGKRRGS